MTKPIRQHIPQPLERPKKVYLADTESLIDYWGIYLIEQDAKLLEDNIIKFEYFGKDTVIPQEDIKRLLELLNNNVLVCHNMGYDATMLKRLMRGWRQELTVADMHEQNIEYFNSTLNMIQQQKDGYRLAKELGRDPLKDGKYSFIPVDSLKGTQKSLKVLQYALDWPVMVETWEDGKTWDTEFLDYFINDVLSLSHIWNNHWALRKTYDTRADLLTYLDIKLPDHDYNTGERNFINPLEVGHQYLSPMAFLEPIFAIDDPQERKYARIDFNNIPEVQEPTFKEHITKYTKGVQGSDEDESKKTKITMWNNEVVYSGGGFHSTYIGQELFEANDDWEIFHADVGSLYPNIMRTNKELFTHINMDLYSDLIFRRMGIKDRSNAHETLPAEKKELKRESNAYKLALNSSYGIINTDTDIDDPNVYNKLGYKKAGQYICLRGHQLLISIIEKYFDVIPESDIKMIQGNTDGVFFQVKKEHHDTCRELAKEWEQENDMTLEVHDFRMIFQRSVNDYIAVDTRGNLEVKGSLKWDDLEASTQTAVPLTVRECIGYLVGATALPEVPKPILDKSNGSLWYLTDEDTGIYPYTGKPSAINPLHFTVAEDKNELAKAEGKKTISRGKIGGCTEGFYLTDDENKASIETYLRLAKLYIKKRTDSDITALKLKPPMISFIDPSMTELSSKIAQKHMDNATAFSKSEIDPKMTSKYLKSVGGARRKDIWKNREMEHLKYLLEEQHHFILGHFKGGKRANENIMGQNVGYLDLDEGNLYTIEETRDLLRDKCGIHCFMGYYTMSAHEGMRKQRHFFLLDHTFRASELDVYKTWYHNLMRKVEEETGITNDQATETLGYVAFAKNPHMDYYIQDHREPLEWYPVNIGEDELLDIKTSTTHHLKGSLLGKGDGYATSPEHYINWLARAKRPTHYEEIRNKAFHMVPYINDVQELEDPKEIIRLFLLYANQWYRKGSLPNTHTDGVMRILTEGKCRDENIEVYNEYKKEYLIEGSVSKLQEVEREIQESQFTLEAGKINVATVGAGKTTFICRCIYRAVMKKEYLTVITDNKDNMHDIRDRLRDMYGNKISDSVLYMDGMTTVSAVNECKTAIVTHHQFLTHRGFSDREYPKMTAILQDEGRNKGLFLVDELQNFTSIRHKDICFEYPVYRSPKASSETIYKKFPYGSIPDSYKAKDGEYYEQQVSISNYVKYVTTDGYNSIDYTGDTDLNKYNAIRDDLNIMRYLDKIPDTETKYVHPENKDGYSYIEKLYKVKVRQHPVEKELAPLFSLLAKCDEAFVTEKIPLYQGEYVLIDEVEHYRGLRRYKNLWTKTLRIRDESIIREKMPAIVGFTASYEENDIIFNGYTPHYCTESYSRTERATVMGLDTTKLNYETILKSGLNTLVVFDLKSQAKERYEALVKKPEFREKVEFLSEKGEAITQRKGDETNHVQYPIKITYKDNARLRGKDLPNIEVLCYDLNYSRSLLLRKTGDDILHKIRQAIGRPLRGHQQIKSFVFFNLNKDNEGTQKMEGARQYLETLVDKVVMSDVWLSSEMYEELKDTPPEDMKPIYVTGNEDWRNSGRGRTIRSLYNYKHSFEIRRYLSDNLQEAHDTNAIMTTSEWRVLLGMPNSAQMSKPSKMWTDDLLELLKLDGIGVNLEEHPEDTRKTLVWFQDLNTKYEDSLAI